MGLVLNAGFALVLLGGGWLLGSFFPAPEPVKKLVGLGASELSAQVDLSSLNWETLSGLLPAEQLASLRQAASVQAAEAGEAILVERADPQAAEEIYLPEEVAPAPAPAPAPGGSPFEAALTLCPKMAISNQPSTEGYAPVVLVNGVAIAVNPTQGACLSSGFGPRNGRTHRGVDYHSDTGGPILAAADGVVLEKKYRDDYGNMLLIDHGQGVYTRYAHLSAFAEGLKVGAQVKQGAQIGLMGNTASYRIPIHLHYELLTGDYANPKGSFGLKANSPFTFPKA